MGLDELSIAIDNMNQLADGQTSTGTPDFLRAVQVVAQELDTLVASGEAQAHPQVIQQAYVGLALVALAIGISRKSISVEDSILALMGEGHGQEGKSTPSAREA